MEGLGHISESDCVRTGLALEEVEAALADVGESLSPEDRVPPDAAELAALELGRIVTFSPSARGAITQTAASGLSLQPLLGVILACKFRLLCHICSSIAFAFAFAVCLVYNLS